MTQPIYEKLRLSLEALSDLLANQLPSESITTSPLDFYAHRLEPLFVCLENIFHQVKNEVKEQEEANYTIRESLRIRSRRLCVEFGDTVFTNLALEKEYLARFDEKLFIIETKLGSEIRRMVAEISAIREMLSKDVILFDDEISLENHSHIMQVFNEHEILKKDLEKKRTTYVKRILAAYKVLEPKQFDDDDLRIKGDYTTVKIDILHRKHRELERLIQERSKYVAVLVDKIEGLKDILYFHHTTDEETSLSISDKNVHALEALVKRLVKIEEQYFETIFSETKEKLFDICSVFGMETADFDKNRENLDIMKKIIHELSLKKDKFLEIQSVILRRDDLTAKMIEFEKSASDPKRLFKSSFQLLDEERFRKTAYPNLLKIEAQVIACIGEFESQFGSFNYKGVNYKDYLSEEIANRIINRNVFIMNKSDTPKKCRR